MTAITVYRYTVLMETKTCEVCKKIIKRGTKKNYGDRDWNKRKTCSIACRGIWIGQQRRLQRPNKTCVQCKKEFSVIESMLHRKFCSTTCQSTHNSGIQHYRFKGKKVTKNGYVRIYVSKTHPFADKTGYLFEHRVVLENHLRQFDDKKYTIEIDGIKYLSPNVIVHHRDHNKSNNTVLNLQPVLTQKEHFSQHYCPHCEHCNKSGELLENPNRTISN